jgi:hypothetical protein
VQRVKLLLVNPDLILESSFIAFSFFEFGFEFF